MSGQYSSNRTTPESIVHNKTRADFNVYYKIVAYASDKWDKWAVFKSN